MKKMTLFVLVIITVLLSTGCESLTEEDATIILEDTLEALRGSETAIFEVVTSEHDKLVVLNAEDYYDTLLLEYNTGNYDYRYMRYIPAKLDESNNQLFYPVYFECGAIQNCEFSGQIFQSQLSDMENDSLFLEGERDEYVYLKAQDRYFDFFHFIDVAQGVITYAKRDAENNVIIDNMSETIFNGDLLGENVSIDTYTFSIYVQLDELLANDPNAIMAMYWLTDTTDLDLTGVEQEIVLEVERTTNKLVSFQLNQSFSNIAETLVIPFARDYEFTIILFKNGQEAIDYIALNPELIAPTVIIE